MLESLISDDHGGQHITIILKSKLNRRVHAHFLARVCRDYLSNKSNLFYDKLGIVSLPLAITALRICGQPSALAQRFLDMVPLHEPAPDTCEDAGGLAASATLPTAALTPALPVHEVHTSAAVEVLHTLLSLTPCRSLWSPRRLQ